MKSRIVFGALALVLGTIQFAQAGDCWDCNYVPGPIETPEPATMGLLAAGVGALALMRARRSGK